MSGTDSSLALTAAESLDALEFFRRQKHIRNTVYVQLSNRIMESEFNEGRWESSTHEHALGYVTQSTNRQSNCLVGCSPITRAQELKGGKENGDPTRNTPECLQEHWQKFLVETPVTKFFHQWYW
jgi:hypothetical protein